MPLGNQLLEVRAIKEEEDIVLQGTGTISLQVEPVKLKVEVLEPKTFSHRIGEKIDFIVRVLYPNDEPLIKGKIKALIGDLELEFTSIESGIFRASFVPTSESEGILKTLIVAEDDFGNSGKTETLIEVSGTSILFDLFQNLHVIALIFLIIVGSVYLARKRILREIVKANLKRKKSELEKEIEKLQFKYYRETSIDREEYKTLMAKYSSELKEVEEKLKGF
jgi:hypothetical protein